MTKHQFAKALQLAASDTDIHVDLSVFDGFGLRDFKPVYTTTQAVAALIRWQAMRLDGQLDYNEVRHIADAKGKFIVKEEEKMSKTIPAELRRTVREAWRAYKDLRYNSSSRIVVLQYLYGGAYDYYKLDQNAWVPRTRTIVSLEAPRWYRGEPQPRRLLLREVMEQVAETLAARER